MLADRVSLFSGHCRPLNIRLDAADLNRRLHPAVFVLEGTMTSEHCNVTDGFSDRDRELLAMFDMTEEQVREAEMIAESETIPDGLVGPVYYGRHHTDASRLGS